MATGGFDIVIGNPPYVNVEKIDAEIKKNISKFATAYQKYDLYVLFYEKGLALTAKKGILCFITSNKFLSQGYGIKLRQFMLSKTINKIINFNYDIFESATVRTCIIQITNESTENNNIKILDVSNKNDNEKFIKQKYTSLAQNTFQDTEDNNFRINLSNRKIELLEKIRSGTVRLEAICSVNYGLRPSSEKLGKKKDFFIHNDNKDNIFKLYFEGKNMGYWTIKEHSYIDYQPKTMYNAMFPELFENTKLVGLRTLSDISKLRFIYDNEGFYCNDSTVVLTLWYLLKDVKNQTIIRTNSSEAIEFSRTYSYKYLQGILNSKLIKFFVNELMYDGTHFYPNHMKALPIKLATPAQQKPIIALVDKILAAKKADAAADTRELEKQIDKLVYALYNLTEEEIKIVEMQDE